MDSDTVRMATPSVASIRKSAPAGSPYTAAQLLFSLSLNCTLVNFQVTDAHTEVPMVTAGSCELCGGVSRPLTVAADALLLFVFTRQ